MRNDLNYVERFLVSISAGSGFVSVSAFASLIGVPVGIESLAVGIKLLEITQKIKNYTSAIKRKNKKEWSYI